MIEGLVEIYQVFFCFMVIMVYSIFAHVTLDNRLSYEGTSINMNVILFTFLVPYLFVLNKFRNYDYTCIIARGND